MFGRTMLRKTRNSLAPSERAASSISTVELEQHGLHRPDDERQRHEQQREHDRRARERDVDADRRLRARRARAASGRRRSSAARTAGRSPRSRALLPRKSSRTSTQAVIVPNDGVDARRRSAAAPSVSFSAATASGDVDDRPRTRASRRFRDAQTSAAIGRATITERNAVDEAEREGRAGPLARTRRAIRGARRAACDGASQWSAPRPPARSSTIRPLFGSNHPLSALRQPPMILSSILKMPGRAGNFDAYFLATAG